MKATLQIDDIKIDIGYELLSRFADSLKDCKENSDLFEKLSLHPAVEVRTEIAYKDNINEATVKRLVVDREIEVVRRILSNSASRNRLDFEILKSLIAKDRDCATTIANNIEEWNSEGFFDFDAKDLAEVIIQHPDPTVRFALADSYRVPKSILKKLSKDPDPYVASTAKHALTKE